MKRKQRRFVQWLTVLLANAYFPGWLRGTIYQGKLKAMCVPFLNCYSCPGAWGACPVGAFQTLAAGVGRKFSYYISGYLLSVGALGGRFVCGWLCPFGLVQELVYGLSRWRKRIPEWLEKLKFVVLGLTVLLPFIWRDSNGLGEPFFCKFICPAGTLGSGLPLLASNATLRSLAGWLFRWKLAVLVVILWTALIYWRPFCRVLCPLGAFYGLLNRVSIWQLHIDAERCTNCGVCARQCPAALQPQVNPNSGSCVRCLECVDVCPSQAISFSRQNRNGQTISPEKAV